MNSGNSSRSKNVFAIISTIIAIIELIVLIIGSLIFPIYFNNSTEQEIVKILGHYLEDINEDATFAEMLKNISTKLNSLEQENANLVADNEQLKNSIKTYEDKETIVKRNSTIIEEATAYATSGNYEQAITVLKNVSDRTSAMDILLAECSEKYQTQVLREAETLMEDKKYDDALLVVDKAIKLLPSNILLTDEYQSIMARYPKKFSELTLSEKKDILLQVNDKLTRLETAIITMLEQYTLMEKKDMELQHITWVEVIDIFHLQLLFLMKVKSEQILI